MFTVYEAVFSSEEGGVEILGLFANPDMCAIALDDDIVGYITEYELDRKERVGWFTNEGETEETPSFESNPDLVWATDEAGELRWEIKEMGVIE